MTAFDIVVRGGRVATAADVVTCDIGIKDGRIVALADRLEAEPLVEREHDVEIAPELSIVRKNPVTARVAPHKRLCIGE